MTRQIAKTEQEMTSQIATESQTPATVETLGAFMESFAYGSRNDLLFKFLKRMPEQDSAEFLRGLLQKVGETIDDGGVEAIYDYVYQWNITGYTDEHTDQWGHDDGPFTPLTKPLAQSRLGLLTASGHFVAGDDPEPFGVKDMTQEEALPRIMDFLRTPPVLSTIPVRTPAENLRVRHPGYDIRGSRKDHNVSLPIDRLVEAADEGLIGDLLPEAFSFVGATAQTPLLKKDAPQWAAMLKERQVDAMLLVPV